MLTEGELARRNNGSLEVRAGGVRVRWEISGVVSSDGHSAAASFSCTVQALDQPVEIKMLEEAMLGSRSCVTIADVAAHFSSALASAGRAAGANDSIELLLSETGQKKMVDALCAAGKALAFSSGVEILGPFELNLESQSFTREKTIKRKAQEQSEQLRRAGDMFQQFQAIRASAPELPAAEILNRLGIADQSDVLRSIMAASAGAQSSAVLWAVAGNSLVKLADGSSPKILQITDALGPIRSVQPDEKKGNLLVGCRSGVMRIDPNLPANPTMYRAGAVNSALGFNSAIMHAGRIWATHAELGLACWKIENPDAPEFVNALPKDMGTPRSLLVVGPKLYFAAGSSVFRIEGDKTSPIRDSKAGDIVALVELDDEVVAVHEDGLICARNDAGDVTSQKRFGRLVATAAMPWLGERRLLVSAESGAILSVGLQDDMVTQFAGNYPGCAVVRASSRSIAAVTPDRQRILIWNAWDGSKPATEIHLASLARHRVADICFEDMV